MLGFTSGLRESHVAHRKRPHAFEVSRWILLATLAVVGATVAVSPAPAAAASPCWKKVVDDWFDGHIEGIYAPHCYRQALRHLPADARAYTTAAGDIERAMLASIRARRPAPPKAAGSESTTRSRSLQSFRRAADPQPMPVRGERPLFERIAGLGASSSASALPLPILLIGFLTALLVAAAGISRLGQRARDQGSSSQPGGRSRRASSRPS